MAQSNATASKPNIVIIMTDQQRADFFRSEGFPLDTMPFVDSLIDRGVRFRRAYTPMPTCGPARTSMFTGRFPKATRVRENWALREAYYGEDLVDVLRAQGYSVNLAGKNHSYLRRKDFDFFSPYMHTEGGREEHKTDQDQAFEKWLRDLHHRVSTEPTPFPLDCQFPVRIVDDAIECVDQSVAEDPDRPFFLWLSFPEPHNPYQVPEPYFSLFPEDEIPERMAGPEGAEKKGPKWRWMRRLIEEKVPGYDNLWRRYRANYCGMIRLIDDQVRRFVTHLEEKGLLDNTIVVFCSDHGDYAADYGLQRKGVELVECLVRVPLFMMGPGVERGKVVSEEFVSLVDIMPTLCEAVGAEIPYGVQGRSLWPMVTGRDYPKAEFESIYAELGFGGWPYGEDERPELHFPYEGDSYDELNSVTQSGNLKMVRKGHWKLLFEVTGRGELYNLAGDPAELNNLYDDPEYAAVRTELLEELLRWTIRTEDDLPTAKYVPKRVPRNWQAAMREAMR